MTPKYSVYIAGAMHNRYVGEVLAERDRAKRYCETYDLTYYDPAESEGLENLEGESLIDIAPSIELMEEYVLKDEHNLDKCRALLVLTGDTNSAGVLWECARAYYLLNIPIFLVAPKMSRLELVNFTTIKADFICASQEEAISLLANYLAVQQEA